jgi:hypothetical protein
MPKDKKPEPPHSCLRCDSWRLIYRSGMWGCLHCGFWFS